MVFQNFDWCKKLFIDRLLTQFGRSRINTVVQLSVNTAEGLGFRGMLGGLLTVVYPNIDTPPTRSKVSFCFLKMDN